MVTKAAKQARIERLSRQLQDARARLASELCKCRPELERRIRELEFDFQDALDLRVDPEAA